MGQFSISQPVPRTEDPKFLKGVGNYVDDVHLAGETYGYVLRSPHAHAEIRKIDTDAAKKAPGVLLVLTAADYLAAGYGTLPISPPPSPNFDQSKMFAPPRLPLAENRVRYVGDEVAFIVAESLIQARDAAEMIEIDYAPLPAAIGTGEALNADAAKIHDDGDGNLSFTYEIGDAEATAAAFENAEHIVSERFVINRVTANSMEGRGFVADFDAGSGRCTLYGGVQSSFGVRRMLADAIFKEPENDFRVVSNDIGGSFGMKANFYPECVLVVWATKLLRRPVRWISDRSEAFNSDCHGRDNISDVELALDKDGKFLALRVHTIANLGAYPSSSPAGPATIHLPGMIGVYKTPVAHVTVEGAYTNTNPITAYRGAGRPEASFVIERIIDIAAQELGMDRTVLRRQNMIPTDAIPYQSPLFFKYDSGDFIQNLDDALDLADYPAFEARRSESASRGMLRGLGISATIERAAPAGVEHAEIRFDPSGTVTVLAGTTNHGQGHHTMYTQMTSALLGVDSDDIRVVEGDTGQVAFGFGTGGSRVSAMGSSAVLLAANKIIDKGKIIAAHILEAAETDIEFDKGVFTVAGTDKSINITEVARTSFMAPRLPAGVEVGLIESGTYRATVANYPTGVHACELEIDPETGAVNVLKYAVVDDVGTVINPLLLKGQIQGGVAQGLGQALMEDIAFDPESGQLLTGSFMDYTMPRGDDLCMMTVKSNPVPTETNPLGIKGAGEAGTIGALPAVVNAVVDALSPLGIRHIDMPATPEKIWSAIQSAKKAEAA
ncbi:MAG: xanthine dehydrogenase family protein molybdopterin-binding subunit [Proteobacteria bacterium]|nr:xanthine dehydrogenase family protein molybdopterin-binding subunit [Pseudomonadota bacterium]